MYNKVFLIGRAGQDPDVRFTPNGAKVVKFSLATSRNYMDSNGNWQEKTEWHNIMLWGKLADKAERIVRKGNLFFIEGSIEYSSWEDQSGNRRYKTEIKAHSIIALSPKNAEGFKQAINSSSNFAGEDNTMPEAKEDTKVDNVEEDLDTIDEPVDDFADEDDVPF